MVLDANEVDDRLRGHGLTAGREMGPIVRLRQRQVRQFCALRIGCHTPRGNGLAGWVLEEFDAYYYESRNIPALAKGAFERRDPATTVELSRRRLSMYSVSMDALAMRLKEAFPGIVADESVWAEVESHCLPAIASRYESDLAFAYLHSVRRRIYRGEWTPVDYRFAETGAVHDFSTDVCRAFHGGAVLTPETMVDILEIPGFSTPWRNLREDAQLVAARVNETLGLTAGDGQSVQGIEMINAGFYRNRGAYLVGRILLHRKPVVPFIIALLNEARGVYVDAVMLSEADAHNIFSSTMANFHVTNKRYHELAAFLETVMPRRPLGLHYSTIGFNHIGKVAVMNELKHRS